jgi:hypothetical protein
LTLYDDAGSVMSPASQAVAISPNDTNDLETPTRGLYVGAGGDVRVTLVGDTNPVTFAGLAGGVAHPIRAKRVWATGTTATGIIGLN